MFKDEVSVRLHLESTCSNCHVQKNSMIRMFLGHFRFSNHLWWREQHTWRGCNENLGRSPRQQCNELVLILLFQEVPRLILCACPSYLCSTSTPRVSPDLQPPGNTRGRLKISQTSNSVLFFSTLNTHSNFCLVAEGAPDPSTSSIFLLPSETHEVVRGERYSHDPSPRLLDFVPL